jgi:hypothetical protein
LSDLRYMVRGYERDPDKIIQHLKIGGMRGLMEDRGLQRCLPNAVHAIIHRGSTFIDDQKGGRMKKKSIPIQGTKNSPLN